MILTADKIPQTRAAMIQDILDSPLKINLMELGFLPGKTIILQHTAPLGGPMAFKLDETILALRKTEASLIEVQLI